MSQDPTNKKGLNVSAGVTPPAQINDNALLHLRRKKILSVDEYFEGIRSGNRNILSQAITLIESSLDSHVELSRSIVSKCLPYSGNSIRIGITGVPGVGKSTFIESFGTYLSSIDRKIAVLAIDPSSNRSGGSILGDKTRMESLSGNKNTYIRPSPSGGSLGGVARKTRESIILCEAAGFDTILIETVGVGQSETAVHSMVDFFLLLMLAGAGDELQGIKRGIMEMADIIAINKADGDNLPKAKIAQTEFRNALHLFPATDSGWIPEVLLCSSIKNTGIKEIWRKIEAYIGHSSQNGFLEERRRNQSVFWLHESIKDNLNAHFYNHKIIKDLLEDLETRVKNFDINSFDAANLLLKEYRKSFLNE
ncbi:MAG: methylmalonyl Co-A mutase-associated GTPase MeaB [Bacteroidales bacterium]|nr:methylmalonyl Co-A mutase-associated GTPase MeaB [Bacteroidales bacterium]MCF8389823.1 methylmalonyl Co-A mutase-associated GTPase MeaB [Bacteroidales bacterium]